MDCEDQRARDERLYEAVADFLESSEQGNALDSAEWLARHPEFAPELQAFLDAQNRIESLTAPVRYVSQEVLKASRSGKTSVPAATAVSPPTGPARPARQFHPRTNRFADELAGVLHGRLLAGTAIAAVAFGALVLVELASPRAGSDYVSLSLYTGMAVYYASLMTLLARHRNLPLSSLRVIEVLGLSAYAVHYAWKDFHHYSRYWETLRAGEQWLLVSHTCLNWVFLIFIYGVLVPNDWRRSLRVMTGMACIPLAVYAASWFSLPASQRSAAPVFDLFAMARLLAAAVAIAVFGAHKFTSLRREAYEAKHLGNYRINRRLSAGGMGEVYLAEHRLLNRPYAIKLIRPEFAADPTSRRRFEREIRAMARLTHWNTAEIIDYGHAPDGTFYYVMEYIDGPNLAELVERHGPADPGRAVYLLRQACAALAEAHGEGLVHRDIKPGNVMLTQQSGLADVVKVLDFGLVQHLAPSAADDKLTRPGVVIGTPGYMPPEQATGTADVRTDVYSLGAVGYFLLTGQAPFSGWVRPPVHEPTPLRELRPEVPADLEAVILRCLRRDPAERFADVGKLDRALAACACAADWSPEQAAAWWRAHPAAAEATAGPGRTAPGHATRVF